MAETKAAPMAALLDVAAEQEDIPTTTIDTEAIWDEPDDGDGVRL